MGEEREGTLGEEREGGHFGEEKRGREGTLGRRREGGREGTEERKGTTEERKST